MFARKSDAQRAQEILEAIDETNERIEAFDVTESDFLHGDDIKARTLVIRFLCAL